MSVSGAIRKAGVADQLGEDAAGPERDERAEDRILDEPGQQLGAAAEHRLHDDREADPLGGRPNRRLVLEVERDAAGLGLVRAGGGRLDDGREAELGGCRDRRVGVLGDPLGHERQAVGGEQLARLGGIEPRVLGALERALDDLRSGSRGRSPSSEGTEPSGRRSHSARSATRPSARAADSG